MKDTFKVYNNEAFVCCVVMKILSSYNRIDIGRLFVLVTIAMTDKIINDKKIFVAQTFASYIDNNENKTRLISTLYNELLTIILNSLTLLAESSNIELFGDKDIIMIKNDFRDIDSNRLNKISNTLPHIMSLTEGLTTKQLYEILKITL